MPLPVSMASILLTSAASFDPLSEEDVLERISSKASPRYVWGWLKGSLYEARLVNAGMGTYKAYRLEPAQYPDDPENLLDWKKK